MRIHSGILRVTLTCGVSIAWTVGAATLARGGEVTSVVDEHGHTIFVNSADLPQAAPLKLFAKLNGKMRRGTRPSQLMTPASQPLYAMRPARLATAPADISTLVEKSAGDHRVDPKLVHAIIQVESAYKTHAVSRKGARGLMQLIPATANRFGVHNIFNPKQNIEGGVTYLRYLLDLFDDDVPLSVAAYNAGENAVLRNGGIPPYTETVNYVQRVTSLYNPGPQDAALAQKLAGIEAAPVYRLVDAHGTVHFTDGEGL